MKIRWDEDAWDDYLYWQKNDKKTIRKINELIKDIQRNKNKGIGKPEQLSNDFNGWWSRRIDEKNRLVYLIIDNDLVIASCKGHYEDK